MDLKDLRHRYLGYGGFITTPACWDDPVQHFLSCAPKNVGAIQRVLYVPDYEYRLSQRVKNFDQLRESALALAKSGCDVIGQVGTNWSHANGTTPDEIEAFCADISDEVGARFIMAGLSIVWGLRAVGARRIAVANGYYRDDWRDGINRFLTEAGFEILSSGNVIDQGLVRDMDEMLAIEAATKWDYPARLAVQMCHRAHLAAPEADAIVQTGSGVRMLPYVEAVEGLCEKPLVSSDITLYWAMLREMKLGTPILEHGYLMRCCL